MRDAGRFSDGSDGPLLFGSYYKMRGFLRVEPDRNRQAPSSAPAGRRGCRPSTSSGWRSSESRPRRKCRHRVPPTFCSVSLRLFSLGAACTASRTASRTCSTGVVSAQIRVDLHPEKPINTVFTGDLADLGTGFIPALAGVAAIRCGPHRRRMVHPRACGGAVGISGGEVHYPGASPRLRGRHRGDCGAQKSGRFIPARAGWTPSRSRSVASRRVHPRARAPPCVSKPPFVSDLRWWSCDCQPKLPAEPVAGFCLRV